jgi:hypothetical protein
MKIARLVAALALLSVVTVFLGATALLMAHRAEVEAASRAENRVRFVDLVHQVEQRARFLTDQARHFAVTGDGRSYDAYLKAAPGEGDPGSVTERFRALGAAPAELQVVSDALADFGSLVTLQRSALKAAKDGDFPGARQLLFDEEHDRAAATLARAIEDLEQRAAQRAAQRPGEPWAGTDSMLLPAAVIFALLGTLLLVFLGIIHARVRPLGGGWPERWRGSRTAI